MSTGLRLGDCVGVGVLDLLFGLCDAKVEVVEGLLDIEVLLGVDLVVLLLLLPSWNKWRRLRPLLSGTCPSGGLSVLPSNPFFLFAAACEIDKCLELRTFRVLNALQEQSL